MVNKNDFNLFGENSIIPSVQSTHATSDMYWAGKRLGEERIKTAYAYKDLLNQNKLIALGTDFPVEDISPFKTFYASVVRKDSKGFPENGFQTENALSREETLKGMSIWAAYAAFEDKEKGSLEKGKAADFIIVDTKQNILFQYNSNDDWFHNLISLKKFYNQEVITVYKKENHFYTIFFSYVFIIYLCYFHTY